jgi:uncharacterized protein YdhG (YjbR/CyaY superfamily)
MTLIDDYLKNVEPAKRKELSRIRALAKEIVPSAEETISYGMPTLKYRGKPFLGFDAHTNHIGIYPYGAQPIKALKDELKGYALSKGAIRAGFDQPISKRLLKKIIDLKIKAIDQKVMRSTGARAKARRSQR